MPDYQTLYTTMFNAATDALEALNELNIGKAKDGDRPEERGRTIHL